jgi:chemotaxis protein CheC
VADQPSIQLNELELDALTELVNIGVSRAAANLASLAREAVALTVPTVSVVTPAVAAQMVGGPRATDIIAVEQEYTGDISGRALLIFPEARGLELVRAIAANTIAAEDIPNLAPEALLETGNIMLQSCLSTIANMLRRQLQISMPKLVQGRPEDLFPQASMRAVLFVHINFTLRNRRISGYIALLMELAALGDLKRLVLEFVRRETH